MTYTATVQGWHDFFIAAAAAAATLVGLLFVGLSLHLHTVVARNDVRTLARVTLTSFSLVLTSALFMLSPAPRPSTNGYELLVTAGASALGLIPSLVRGRSSARTLPVRQLTIRFGLCGVGYAAVVYAGALLLSADAEDALTAMLIATLVLLVVSLRNTWDLLVTVGAARLSDSAG